MLSIVGNGRRKNYNSQIFIVFRWAVARQHPKEIGN